MIQRFSPIEPGKKRPNGRIQVPNGKDVYHFLLIGLFFLSGFSIVHQLETTLIPLMETSKLFAWFGTMGFGVSYVLRTKLNLTIYDGLAYSVFGAAPAALALFLWINVLGCGSAHNETYRIDRFVSGGDGAVMELEGRAYAEFWRIRNLEAETTDLRNSHVSFSFCEGILGYKVLKNRELK